MKALQLTFLPLLVGASLSCVAQNTRRPLPASSATYVPAENVQHAANVSNAGATANVMSSAASGGTPASGRPPLPFRDAGSADKSGSASAVAAGAVSMSVNAPAANENSAPSSSGSGDPGNAQKMTRTPIPAQPAASHNNP